MSDVLENIVITGNGNGAAIELLPQGSSAMIYNTSNTESIWIGNNPALTPVYSNAIEIEPLGYLVISAVAAVYGCAQSGITVNVAILPGGQAFFTPQLNATITGPVSITGDVDVTNTPSVTVESGEVIATISGTPTIQLEAGSEIEINNADINVVGSGGYILAGQLALLLDNTAAWTAPAGEIGSRGPFNVENYNSVIFSIINPTNSSTAAGAALCAMFQFLWSDANGNNIGQADTISVICGCNIVVQVPVKGSQLNINFTNIGETGTLTVAVGDAMLWGDYREVSGHQVLSYSITAFPTITGWTVLQGNIPMYSIKNWIANINESSSEVAESTSYIIPLVPYSGPVQGWYQQVGNALSNDATIVDLSWAVQGGLVAGTGYQDGILANLPSAVQSSPVNVQYNSPPTQLAFLFKTSTTLGTTFLMLTGTS